MINNLIIISFKVEEVEEIPISIFAFLLVSGSQGQVFLIKFTKFLQDFS